MAAISMDVGREFQRIKCNNGENEIEKTVTNLKVMLLR